MLDTLPANMTVSHQPYWITRAHLFGVCGEPALRRQALERAAGLTQERRVREHLLAQLNTGDRNISVSPLGSYGSQLPRLRGAM